MLSKETDVVIKQKHYRISKRETEEEDEEDDDGGAEEILNSGVALFRLSMISGREKARAAASGSSSHLPISSFVTSTLILPYTGASPTLIAGVKVGKR